MGSEIPRQFRPQKPQSRGPGRGIGEERQAVALTQGPQAVVGDGFRQRIADGAEQRLLLTDKL